MSKFLTKIFAATRLTQRGRLAEATDAIQQALAAVATPAATPAARPQTVSMTTEVPEEALVLDGLVREAPTDNVDADADTVDIADRPAASRFTESSFTAAAGTRGFKLFEPAGLDGSPRPLVVMLHGCTQDADDFAAGTRMNALAQERGLFVLYPEQAPRSNAHKCWNWFVPNDQRRGQGEPALLAGMVRHVMATHAIDADRVYVAGLSAGGAMAAILAREYSDLFAAAGVHSGLPPGAAHDIASAFTAMQSGVGIAAAKWAGLTAEPTRTPLAAWPSIAPREVKPSADAARGAPLIVFHGDADTTVNALNGEHVVEAALGTGSWQTVRSASDATGRDARAFTRTVYRPADGAPDAPSRVEHWVVHGASHAWSGGDKSGTYTDAAGPDASREMLRFFAEHPHRHDEAKAFRS